MPAILAGQAHPVRLLADVREGLHGAEHPAFTLLVGGLQRERWLLDHLGVMPAEHVLPELEIGGEVEDEAFRDQGGSVEVADVPADLVLQILPDDEVRAVQMHRRRAGHDGIALVATEGTVGLHRLVQQRRLVPVQTIGDHALRDPVRVTAQAMHQACEVIGSEDGLLVVVDDVGIGWVGAVLFDHVLQSTSLETGVIRCAVARGQQVRRHRDDRVAVAGLESDDLVDIRGDDLHPNDLLQHRIAGDARQNVVDAALDDGERAALGGDLDQEAMRVPFPLRVSEGRGELPLGDLLTRDMLVSTGLAHHPPEIEIGEDQEHHRSEQEPTDW